MRTKEDANSNLLSRISLKGSPTNTTSGLSLEILGEETGSGTSALYTYDVFNNMIGVLEGNNRVESKYNGNGQRVEKTVNGTTTRYLYEYDQVILEVDGSNTQTGRNIYGLNLLRRKEGAANLDYLYNGHGDVTNLMNGTAIAATYYYDAFGNVLEDNTNYSNNYLYSGYQYDRESKLYYLNARHYNPLTSRFMQEDTYLNTHELLSGGSPSNNLVPTITEFMQTLNLYTYCVNNPIKYSDPTGYWQPGDENLNPMAQQAIQKATDDYNKAAAAGDKQGMANAHAAAELARANGGTTTTATTITTVTPTTPSNNNKGSTGSTGSTGSSVTGINGVDFGPGEGPDWQRTASGLSFEEYWGCGPYGTPASIPVDISRMTASTSPAPPFANMTKPTNLVVIRDFTESRFGTVGWNAKTSMATFTIYGTTLTTSASGSNNHGLTIINVNGRMMADDADLIKFFGVVSYNRDDAIQYAVDNFNKSNPDYYSYSTDCANFVSQSLYAGGINMNNNWHSYNLGTKSWWVLDPGAWFKESKRYDWDVSEAWRLVPNQYEYFSNPLNGYINGSVIALTGKDDIAAAVAEYHIQAGDLMYFAGVGGTDAHHATIISRINNGKIEYAAHTEPRQYRDISEAIGNETVFIIRIRN